MLLPIFLAIKAMVSPVKPLPEAYELLKNSSEVVVNATSEEYNGILFLPAKNGIPLADNLTDKAIILFGDGSTFPLVSELFSNSSIK